MTDTQDQDPRWIARLTPMTGTDVARLLQMPLGLDIWERNPDALVVRAHEGQLKELERRRLATVERLCTESNTCPRKKAIRRSHRGEHHLHCSLTIAFFANSATALAQGLPSQGCEQILKHAPGKIKNKLCKEE